jgi:hypothetical protein
MPRRFSKQCSPELLGAWIYLWHPDALDTIDDYFGTESRFVNSKEKLKWITSINIAQYVSHQSVVPSFYLGRCLLFFESWTLRPDALSDRDLDRFDENRSNGDFPPRSVARLGLDSAKKTRRRKKKLATEALPIVDERSSCLVMSGDQQGYFWQCSVWSSVTDAEGVAEQSIRATEKVLHHFINRQGSARCLVFLVLLGHLCEHVAIHYDDVLSRLDDILGLGVSLPLLSPAVHRTTAAVAAQF